MRNPFRSEPEAFHFLLLTVVAFAAIALASLLGGAWAGLAVWAVATAVAVVYYLRPRRARRSIRTAPPHVGAGDERRILVVGDETLADERLLEAVERAAAGHRGRVLVVCPALTPPARHWASDVDGARAQSEQWLGESLSGLRAAGIEAKGEIGDEDPLQAIEDALRTFGADEIIVSTLPEGSSSRLEPGGGRASARALRPADRARRDRRRACLPRWSAVASNVTRAGRASMPRFGLPGSVES